MEHELATRFVESWLEAWNAHEVDALLAHFDDNVTFTSPMARLIVPNSNGVIEGKESLRLYWQEGMRLIPDLHFELIDFYVGVNVLVINYRNQKGARVNEVLLFDGNVVVEGHGTYLDAGN
jgi:hypothetical protein